MGILIIMTSLTAASSSPHALSVSYEVIDAIQRTLEKEGKKTKLLVLVT